MPIPIEKGRSTRNAKEIKRLQLLQENATKRIRRLLVKAFIYAIEASNSVDGAEEQMQHYLDAAFDAGLAPDAIRSGPINGMPAKIMALLDRPPAQAHALGLLMAASDLLAEFDTDLASQVSAIADSLDTSTDWVKWRNVATPRRQGLVI